MKKHPKTIPSNLMRFPIHLKKYTLYGNISLLNTTCIGIVGTRKASELGRETAYKLANNLIKNDITIVSGLASGIDECAHNGGITSTIAIVAGGFNEILKGEKYKLAKAIVDNNGLILSEYPENMPTLSYQFLERNRLISALSNVIVVVEAPLKSGAINTATHAIRQNKKIFAVPWNIDYWKGEGCNNLLALGATPLINYNQIVSFLFASTKQLSFEDLFISEELEASKNAIIPDEYKGYYESSIIN